MEVRSSCCGLSCLLKIDSFPFLLCCISHFLKTKFGCSWLPQTRCLQACSYQIHKVCCCDGSILGEWFLSWMASRSNVISRFWQRGMRTANMLSTRVWSEHTIFRLECNSHWYRVCCRRCSCISDVEDTSPKNPIQPLSNGNCATRSTLVYKWLCAIRFLPWWSARMAYYC